MALWWGCDNRLASDFFNKLAIKLDKYKNMGNPDVVYIFNNVVAVLVKGEQYQDNGKTPLGVAIEIYNQKAKENIDYYNGIKSGLTPIDENYKPEDDWEIVKISKCEPINF